MSVHFSRCHFEKKKKKKTDITQEFARCGISNYSCGVLASLSAVPMTTHQLSLSSGIPEPFFNHLVLCAVHLVIAGHLMPPCPERL